jgi:hypothetical protein
LGSAATHIVSGAAQGLGLAAQSNQTGSGGPVDLFVDKLLRPAAMQTAATPAAAQAASGPAATNAGELAVHREMSRLLTASLRTGTDLAPADRTYVAQVVAARTGLSQAEADRRVSDVITQAKAAADEARKAAAHLALWLTAALLMGAFAASLAATEGGGLRDGTWSYERLPAR